MYIRGSSSYVGEEGRLPGGIDETTVLSPECAAGGTPQRTFLKQRMSRDPVVWTSVL